MSYVTRWYMQGHARVYSQASLAASLSFSLSPYFGKSHCARVATDSAGGTFPEGDSLPHTAPAAVASAILGIILLSVKL